MAADRPEDAAPDASPPEAARPEAAPPEAARPEAAPRLPAEALEAFAAALLRAGGAAAEEAAVVAANMVWNDLAGRDNHGVERLPILLRRLRAGLIASPCRLRWERLGPAAMRLDGGNGFGQYLGEIAMRRAISLAREAGIGAVGVRGSNFFGTGAYFVELAAARGMIGVALSNSFPKVAAPGGRGPVIGTNPLAFGAPRRDGRSLLLDMSTAALAGSTLRAHQRSGTPLPEGLAIDAAGAPLTDPAAAGGATLLPAAGAKGFGLGLMVEILAGVLTGAGVAGGVGSLYADFDRPGNSGHMMLALDIERWMPRSEFLARIEALAASVVEAGARDPQVPPRIPGAARWEAMEENRARGIALAPEVRAALAGLARELGVAAPAGLVAPRGAGD